MRAVYIVEGRPSQHAPETVPSHNRAHSDIMSHLSAVYISHLLTLPHTYVYVYVVYHIHNVLITVTVDSNTHTHLPTLITVLCWLKGISRETGFSIASHRIALNTGNGDVLISGLRSEHAGGARWRGGTGKCRSSYKML